MEINNSLASIQETEGILTHLGVQPIIIQVLLMIVVVFIIGYVFLFPVLRSIQKMNSNNSAEISKTDADTLVWSNLKETLEFHIKEVENSREENRRLYDLIKEMQIRLKKLEDIEIDFIKLKKKLNEKDQLISFQYEQLKSKDIQILELIDRIKNLEDLINHRHTLQ